MNPNSFREYDIRGVVGKDLDAEGYHRLGLALGTHYESHGDRTVAVGRDVRASSEEFASALRRGLTETGRRVLDLGLVSTPMTVFGLNFLGTDGSVAVTASHNPAEYNGAKVRRKTPIYGEALQRVREIFEKGDFAKGEGGEEAFDVRDAYLSGARARVAPARSLKVVVDAGNGCAGLVVEDLMKALGMDVVPLYCEPDGSFPNHHPDPTKPEYLTDLQAAVKEHGADCGFAFDGDGDRVTVVDENGTIHWADRMIMLMAKALLDRRPGGQVVYDVKCSQGVADVVRGKGGTATMVKTGYPHVLARMADETSVLGGELSGHIYFGGDPLFNFDDGVYSAIRFLDIVAADERPLSQQLADLPAAVSTPEIRLEVPEERKFAITDELTEAFRGDSDVVELIDVDGARVVFPEGWGLVRASNTQPDLVLVFEARDEDGLKRVKSRFAKRLGAFDEIDGSLD